MRRMRRRALTLAVVALVFCFLLVDAAKAAPRRYGFGEVAYLGRGAEWWHYQFYAAKHGWRPADAHGQKHPGRFRTVGHGLIGFDGHGPEWWHRALVRLSERAAAALPRRIVSIARRYIGVPYRWGGTTPAGFDCSGLVRYVFGRAGIRLPRTSWEQMAVSRPVRLPTLGNLVFFSGGEHVGIYIGGDRYIEAPHAGATVDVRRLTGRYTFRSVF